MELTETGQKRSAAKDVLALVSVVCILSPHPQALYPQLFLIPFFFSSTLSAEYLHLSLSISIILLLWSLHLLLLLLLLLHLLLHLLRPPPLKVGSASGQ